MAQALRELWVRAGGARASVLSGIWPDSARASSATIVTGPYCQMHMYRVLRRKPQAQFMLTCKSPPCERRC